MTINTTAASVTYQGNGAGTVFPYSFQILQASHAVVTVVDTTVSPPTTTQLSPSVYSITGLGAAGGGSVTYPLSGSPLAAGQYLTIQRVVPYTQPTSLTNQGGFYPAAIEAALDYITQELQQIAAQQARSLQVGVSDPGGAPAVLPVASLRANQYLLFDASGNPIAGGMSSSSVAINAAMYGLVQAASVAAARTFLLGFDPAAGDAGKSLIATGAGSYALAGPLKSFRNLLINADGAVNQRNYASGTATTTANQYTLDRWRVVTSGQNLTLAAAGRGFTMTAPAGGLEQVVEGLNIEGGTYTLSWTGTATATVNGSAVANGGQVTLPANTNATVRFTGGTVSKPQLELGSVVTPFDFRPYSTELERCQRYAVVFSTPSSLIGVGSARPTGGTAHYVAVTVPVPMRATPTVNFTGTPQMICGDGGVGAISSMGSPTISGNVVSLTGIVSATSATTSGYATMLSTNNGTITFSSEL